MPALPRSVRAGFSCHPVNIQRRTNRSPTDRAAAGITPRGAAAPPTHKQQQQAPPAAQPALASTAAQGEEAPEEGASKAARRRRQAPGARPRRTDDSQERGHLAKGAVPVIASSDERVRQASRLVLLGGPAAQRAGAELAQSCYANTTQQARQPVAVVAFLQPPATAAGCWSFGPAVVARRSAPKSRPALCYSSKNDPKQKRQPE